MDLRKLKTLIDLVSESNVSELEITEAEGTVRIVKAVPSAGMAPLAPMAYPMQQQAMPVPTAQQRGDAFSAAAPAEAPVRESGFTVKSPMVGTFYRASTPGGKPFVDVGDSVKEGDVLCIIEAMKILNEIEAEKSGVIRRVMLDNGAPVEYGQALFVIE